jgi:glutathione S-transferase
MQYLGAERKTPLWPDDAKTRADIMRWQSWHLQHWSRGVTPYLFENLVKPLMGLGEPDQKAWLRPGRCSTRTPPCSTSISSGIPISSTTP